MVVLELDECVELQVEENRHRFDKRLVKFGFDVDVAVVGETGVPVSGTVVQHEIEDDNERPFRELGEHGLDARLSVVYPETAEERLIVHRVVSSATHGADGAPRNRRSTGL